MILSIRSTYQKRAQTVRPRPKAGSRVAAIVASMCPWNREPSVAAGEGPKTAPTHRPRARAHEEEAAVEDEYADGLGVARPAHARVVDAVNVPCGYVGRAGANRRERRQTALCARRHGLSSAAPQTWTESPT